MVGEDDSDGKGNRSGNALDGIRRDREQQHGRRSVWQTFQHHSGNLGKGIYVLGQFICQDSRNLRR